MKLEQQVVSLELAKKLKKLGVKQNSLFYFYGDEIERGKRLYAGGGLVGRPKPQDPFSAFTVAELGEMLPLNTKGLSIVSPYPEDKNTPKDTPWFWEVKNIGGWEKTEADARAKMLIYLIENNLITL